MKAFFGPIWTILWSALCKFINRSQSSRFDHKCQWLCDRPLLRSLDFMSEFWINIIFIHKLMDSFSDLLHTLGNTFGSNNPRLDKHLLPLIAIINEILFRIIQWFSDAIVCIKSVHRMKDRMKSSEIEVKLQMKNDFLFFRCFWN